MQNKIIESFEELNVPDGYSGTFLPEVSLFKSSRDLKTMPVVYEQCICFALQGSKVARTSDNELEYDPQNYLVVPTVVPFNCETKFTEEEPFLGLTVELDFAVLHDVLDSIGKDYLDAAEQLAPQPGMYLERVDKDICDVLTRLIKCLRTEGEATVLGKQIIRELLYRALMGEQGHILASAARTESMYARIAIAIRTIHDNYSQPIDVTSLAESSNMSVRSFHNHFKAATSCTPFQYLKKIRLDKARQLLVSKNLQANVTAHMVGYESTSQFSREFKKFFGYPPKEAHKNFSPKFVR